MALAPGSRLGPYEIVSVLGAGGMGKVYRARDSRLERTVAIKTIAGLAGIEELRSRFEREARTISRLNHPNICTLYDVGRQDETDFIVLEYVEGETLAARLAKAPLTIPEVLSIATQIAEALAVAHRSGIAHRDLKPGNVMLTTTYEGMTRLRRVKLLDFGLAAAVRPHTRSAHDHTGTGSIPLTRPGSILGTLPYMAPEQVNGQPADTRADIWSFGCVVHEMLTRRRPFEGHTDAALAAAILEREPPSVCQLRPETPAALDRLVSVCLLKAADERWQSAHDLWLELRSMREGPPPAGALARPPRRAQTAYALAGVFVGATVAAAILLFLRAPTPSGSVVRAAIPLPPNGSFSPFGSNVVISPDGQLIVYVGREGPISRLYMRRIDRLEATGIRGTEGAETPFFAPDGRQVAFQARGMLKRVSLDGGAPEDIYPVASARGGAWGADGTIVFTPSFNEGLWRLNPGGGTPEPFTRLDESAGERTHRFPEILPDGRTVLFMVGNSEMTSFREAQIVAQSLDGGPRKVIHRGGLSPRYLHPGRLLYNTGDALVAVPFDPVRLEITGTPATIVEDVAWSIGFGVTHYAVGGEGHVAYIPGDETFARRRLTWMDREGKRIPVGNVSSFFLGARLSPDGDRLLLLEHSANDFLHVYDIPRQALTRLTFRGSANYGAWTADGAHITYIVAGDIARVSANGSGTPETLYSDTAEKLFVDVSSDGRRIVFDANRPGTRSDIMMLEQGAVRPWQATRFIETQPRFSPDGHWIAYVSDEAGRFEVFVRSERDGRKVQVSTQGGTSPVWSPGGDELFFVRPLDAGAEQPRAGDLYAVDMSATAAGPPRLVVRGAWPRPTIDAPLQIPVYGYDVMPDGKRFVVIESDRPPSPGQINLFWGALAGRHGPAGATR